jgi:hypothetical protein
VIYFFDSMNFPFGPAATRWAALFLGRNLLSSGFPGQFLKPDTRGWND